MRARIDDALLLAGLGIRADDLRVEAAALAPLVADVVAAARLDGPRDGDAALVRSPAPGLAPPTGPRLWTGRTELLLIDAAFAYGLLRQKGYDVLPVPDEPARWAAADLRIAPVCRRDGRPETTVELTHLPSGVTVWCTTTGAPGRHRAVLLRTLAALVG